MIFNEMGADGWEYVRTDTLPNEERVGLTQKTITYRNLLVFRKTITPPAPEPVAPAIENQADRPVALLAPPVPTDLPVATEMPVASEPPAQDVTAPVDTPDEPLPADDTTTDDHNRTDPQDADKAAQADPTPHSDAALDLDDDGVDDLTDAVDPLPVADSVADADAPDDIPFKIEENDQDGAAAGLDDLDEPPETPEDPVKSPMNSALLARAKKISGTTG